MLYFVMHRRSYTFSHIAHFIHLVNPQFQMLVLVPSKGNLFATKIEMASTSGGATGKTKKTAPVEEPMEEGKLLLNKILGYLGNIYVIKISFSDLPI